MMEHAHHNQHTPAAQTKKAEPVISVRNVSYSYEPGLQVLKDIDLDIEFQGYNVKLKNYSDCSTEVIESNCVYYFEIDDLLLNEKDKIIRKECEKANCVCDDK